MKLEFINMKRTEYLKVASDRLKEAQQLLSLGIEKENISSIERDLILEKLRNAYESILFEKEIGVQVIHNQLVAQPLKVNVEKVHEIPPKPNTPEVKPQSKVTTANTQSKEKVQETSKPVARTSIFDPVKESKKDSHIEEPIVGKEPESPKKQKEQSILNPEQPESLAEKFQGKRKFVTDSLSNQIQSKPVAAKLQDKPIKDITKEIGVHDKFLFIKELFNGDNQLYDVTLKKVNQFNDITEALIYIQENFNWNENNKAANKFIELIRRKLLND